MYKVYLERTLSNYTNDTIVNAYLNKLKTKANRVKNWTIRFGAVTQEKNEDNQWVVKTHFICNKVGGWSNAEVKNKQWEKIVYFLYKACKGGIFHKHPWKIVNGVDEQLLYKIKTKITAQGRSQEEENTSIVKDYYKNLSLDPKNHFNHIYDRDNQIRIIQCAIKAAAESDFINRFHCVLFGPPGCGKTDLLISTANMLGKENEAWMKFDATSTTEAGASRLLLESAYIPPVLIVEEIEKTEEKSLRWLLGILDQRAEIRKTNFRIGNKARNVKMLVLATVNDIGLFRKAMSGALASRFPNEIYCPRPSREILSKILSREVEKVKGKQEWVEATLKYCYDNLKWDDPRKLVPICLQGMDSLLDGSYQAALDATRPPKNYG